MGRRSLAAIRKSFFDEVAENFAFATKELSFVGPELNEEVLQTATFTSDRLRLVISLDHHEMMVSTHVESKEEHRTLVADLPDVVEAAGLDSRNHVPGTVHSLSDLRRVLRDHADYVRQTVSELDGPQIGQLMQKSAAREQG